MLPSVVGRTCGWVIGEGASYVSYVTASNSLFCPVKLSFILVPDGKSF